MPRSSRCEGKFPPRHAPAGERRRGRSVRSSTRGRCGKTRSARRPRWLILLEEVRRLGIAKHEAVLQSGRRLRESLHDLERGIERLELAVRDLGAAMRELKEAVREEGDILRETKAVLNACRDSRAHPEADANPLPALVE